MRAVNLLPERHRPRRAASGKSGGSYIVLGVLGALLVALVAYVLTLNSINSNTDAIAVAKAETEQAQAKTRSLSAYGDFAKVKEKRVTAVTQLAQARFDWERLVRELAHVLPEDVWLTKSEASAAGAPDSSGAAATGAATSAAGAPTVKLSGCARDQELVAVTLVRLRELQGADDVKLDRSAKPADTGAGSAAGDDKCGATRGRPNYAFDAVVTFEAQAAAAAAKPSGETPARLGGGA